MNPILRNSAAGLLALATLATCFWAGSLQWGINDSGGVWQSAMFAVAMMIAFGAHAVGHYAAARRSGVHAHPPYFVPALTFTGMGGAYVKLRWPIDDLRAIRRIFVTGPIAGFSASSLLFLSGLPLSTVVPITSDQLMFGDSLLTAGAQRLVFPDLPNDQGVMLHPVALAGYFGFYFNLWQLFPVGRFDAGRISYAVFGYRRARVMSWVTIGILLALTAVSAAWLTVAVFGALTMIRIGRQHPPIDIVPPLEKSDTYQLLALLGIFILIFVPVPVRFVT